MDTDDITLLRHWIGKHWEATGSPRAKWVLDNWGQILPKFLKIFPHEYKRVLGIPRKKPDSEKVVTMPSSIATKAVNKQVIHG